MSTHPTRALEWTALLAGAVTVARQAVRLRRALRAGHAAVRRTHPFQRRLAQPGVRVLVLGDSTGVGVGAEDPAASFAGLLAQKHPGADVVNLSVSGARLADVARQVRSGLRSRERFDLVLLHIGGNDVLAGTSLKQLARRTDAMLNVVCPLAPKVLWIGIANIGLAPVFLAPLSWWLSARARKAARLFAEAARQRGVRFVDFHREAAEDPFSQDVPRYFAPDGVHPSAEGYRYCFETVQEQAALDRWLAGRARHSGEGRGQRLPVHREPATAQRCAEVAMSANVR